MAALGALWLIYFVVPNNPYFLYSVLPGAWKNFLSCITFGILIEGRAMLQYTLLVLLILTYGFIDCQGTTFWLTQIR